MKALVNSGLVPAAIAIIACSSAARAQTEPAPRPAATTTIGPPIRRIATASALSTEELGVISGVLELPDGRVLVNDGVRRRLLLMDTTLKTVEVVLDSLSEQANTYGTRPGTLIPYRGDSVLFVDPVSYAILVLDPNARIARVRSVWRVQDTYMFTAPSGAFGWPAPDARGRIVYRVPAQPAPPKVAPPPGVPYFPPPPDSAFIVGVDLDTRKIDTLGSIRIPKSLVQIRQTPEGYFNFIQTINPLPTTDEWAVLPDGALAVVRGRDYRVEYLRADGTWTSSSKLPYDWQRLTDEDKQKLVDSVKQANQKSQMTSYVAAMIRWVNMYNKPYPPGFKVPEDYRLPNGLSKDWKFPEGLKVPENYIYACAPGVEPTMRPLPNAPAGARAAAPAGPVPVGPGSPPGPPQGIPSCIPSPVTLSGGNAPPAPTLRDVSVMPADELPDYRPPFATGAVRADADGNLWVHTNPTKPAPGGTVYDIVSRQGDLVDRLQLPPGYTIVGFGRGKIVYLAMRDAKGIHLARVRLR